MKNIKKILFLFLVYPFVNSYSQKNTALILETGYLINKPLKAEDHFISDGGSTSSFDYHYKYSTAVGNYVKLGKEKYLFSGTKMKVFLPFGATYLKQNYKYYLKGYYSGCFSSGVYDNMIESYNQYIGIYTGLGISYQERNWLVSASTALSKAYLLPNNNSSKSMNLIPYIKSPLYLSSQMNLMFAVNKKVMIGTSCEVYYLKFNSLRQTLNRMFDKDNSIQHSMNNYSIDLNGKSIWINPAIKLQIGL